VRCRFVAVTVGAVKSSVTVKPVPSALSAEVAAMTLSSSEPSMSMDVAPAALSEPPLMAQSEKLASPNCASGRMPELSEGASAMTSAEACSADASVLVVANDFPVVASFRLRVKDDPVDCTEAVSTSPGLTVNDVICCMTSGNISYQAT
jgi:hypothetical protein